MIQKQLSFRHHQDGRTMLEMLAVLAIMGVLSVAIILGLQYAMAKLKANQILKDARLSHTMLQTNLQDRELATEYHQVLFNPISGLEVHNRFKKLKPEDEEGVPQTKFSAVSQKPCEMLIHFGPPLSVYTHDMHLLTTCEESQDIVIILDLEPDQIPVPGCTGKDDCENGYCEEGKCVTCPEGQSVNEAGTGCTIFCNDEQDVCDDGDNGHTWCCPKKQCTPEYPKCAVTDGKCSWEFTQDNPEADCSWRFNQTSPQSNCAWRFTQLAPSADCTVTLTYSADNTSVTNFTTTGCPAGQYCYVAYTDSDCDATNHAVQNNSTGTLHGVCNALTTTNTTCVPKVTMQEVDNDDVNKCPAGQYCYLNYSALNCSGTLTNDASGIMYGVCNPMTTTNTTCVPKVTMEEVDGCDAGQYCYLNYPNEGCSGTLANNASGTMYGVCNVMATTNTTCVPKVHMNAKQYCPQDQYCLLKWPTNDDCSGSLSNNATGTLYGACADMDKADQACPY